jgi:hypothetical protein
MLLLSMSGKGRGWRLPEGGDDVRTKTELPRADYFAARHMWL